MPDTPELSAVKRALLEKYLQGKRPQSAKNVPSKPVEEQPAAHSLKDIGTPVVPVVPLQTSGSKPPFFYLHVHVEGGAFYCFTLSHTLGVDQPFYILEPCKYEHLPLPPTLEDIAAAYIESMRTVQPEGPYFLGGYCGGGLIAYEMARQLFAAGQEIAFVLLIDAKDGPAPHRMRFRNRLGDLVRRTSMLLRRSQQQQASSYIFLEREYIYFRHVYDYLRIHFRRLQNSLGLESDEHREHGRIGDRKSPAFPRRKDFGVTGRYIGPPSEAWIGTFVWAISHYQTRFYPGKITCIWAEHTLGQERLHINRKEEGEVPEAELLETHILPGDHSGLINEHVHDLAACLKTCLTQAQEMLVAGRDNNAAIRSTSQDDRVLASAKKQDFGDEGGHKNDD